MNGSVEWLDRKDSTPISARVPAGGFLLAVVFGPGGSASRLARFPSAAALGNGSEENAFIRILKQFTSDREEAPEFRLIGEASAIEVVDAEVRKAGLAVGRSVTLTRLTEPVCFYPDSGKIRVPIGVVARPTRRRRVLIVDDSATICKLLRRIVEDDPELECVGTIQDPRVAEKEIRALRPDVVTMDIHMPEVSGIELVRRVMATHPVPIVLISSLSLEEGGLVLEGLSLGAVDYIQKPTAGDLAASIPNIREKIRAASTARPQIARASTGSSTASASLGVVPFERGRLIAIGASTGGTEAIREVLAAFPEKIPPVLIVQHIPAVFSKAFADRLNGMFRFRVKEAEDGDLVVPDTVFIAPGGRQMRVRSEGDVLRLRIDDSDPVNRHRPSVDALFESLVHANPKRISACILTGMGGDGARGMLELRKRGARTFAQDEATSVVYGMPREAFRIGAVESVVSIQEIGHAIFKSVSTGLKSKAS